MEYLNENIISSISEDQFGHIEIAKEIANIINSNEIKESSLTIGIFGKWGVGKSSIVRLLKDEVLPEAVDNLLYIDIPIWKYSDPKSIRRKFIYQIAQKFGKLSEVKKMYQDSTVEINENILTKLIDRIGLIFKDSIKILLLFIIICSVYVTVNVFYQDSLDNTFKTFLNISLLVPILGMLIQLIEVLKNTKLSIITRAFESEEEFEHTFQDQILNDKTTKKVIVIDDLDRCSKSKILAVFEVIKNFMDTGGCIFLIACDPLVLKEAIEKEESSLILKEESTSYLDKIFQFTLYVPQHMPQNMRSYVQSLILQNKINLFENDKIRLKLDQIIYVLIYKNTINPRKAKTLINKFISNYKLAERLEEDPKSFLKRGSLTSFPERLAFITVIKSEFPALLEKLTNAPIKGLYEWLILAFKNEDFNEALKDFFDQNKSLLSEDWELSPYIYMNLDPSINDLPEELKNISHNINKDLRNGFVENILPLFEEKNELIPYFLKFSINQFERTINIVEKRNILKSIIASLRLVERDFSKLNLSLNSNLHFVDLIVDSGSEFKSDDYIKFTSYLLNHDVNSGKKLFEHFLFNYKYPDHNKLIEIFNCTYFDLYDKYCKKSIQGKLNFLYCTDVYKVYIEVTSAPLKYEYFRIAFENISFEYNEYLTKKEEDLDPQNMKIEELQPIFLNTLYEQLKFNVQDFSLNFNYNIEFDVFVEKFIQKFNTDDVLIFNQLFKTYQKLIIHQNINFSDAKNLLIFDTISNSVHFSNSLSEFFDSSAFNYFNDNGLGNISAVFCEGLLGVITKIKTKLGYKFDKFDNNLLSKIDYSINYSVSQIIFKYIASQTGLVLKTTEVFCDEVNDLFLNPVFLTVEEEVGNIVNDYFDYLYFLKKNSDYELFNFDTESINEINENHTFHPQNIIDYSNNFITNTFLLISEIAKDNVKNNPFKIFYFDILKLHNDYLSTNLFEIVVKNAIEGLRNNIVNISGYNIPFESHKDSVYLDSMKAIEDNYEINKEIRDSTFKLRFVLFRSWWPNTDIKYLLKERRNIIDKSSPINKAIINRLRDRLIYVLSPSKWDTLGKYDNITGEVLELTKILINNFLYHSQDLIEKITDTLKYYVSTEEYSYSKKYNIIKCYLDFLNTVKLDEKDILHKGKFENVMREILKYKHARTLGRDIKIKYNLKIADRNFKKK